MRAVQDGGAPVTPGVVRSMETCVQCLGCETACPSGVPFGRLIEGTRAALADAGRLTPRWQRLGFRLLGRHRLLLAGSSVLAVAQRMRLVPSKRLGLPARLPIRRRPLVASGRDVHLFTGCVMDAWQRDTHHAVQEVVEAAGVGVHPTGATTPCCGALSGHAGLHAQAESRARQVIAGLDDDAPVLVDSAGLRSGAQGLRPFAGYARGPRLLDPRFGCARVVGGQAGRSTPGPSPGVDRRRFGPVPSAPRPGRASVGSHRARTVRPEPGRARRRGPLLWGGRCIRRARTRTGRRHPGAEGGRHRSRPEPTWSRAPIPGARFTWLRAAWPSPIPSSWLRKRSRRTAARPNLAHDATRERRTVVSAGQITKVLVANRGEIAIRAFRAAHQLGIRTVAIHTYEDRTSLHRLKADEAYEIGEKGHPVRSYLDVGLLVDTALSAGADAMYPGYGFLSESPDLAAACVEAGIRFIGPDASVLELTGNKMRARQAAEDCRPARASAVDGGRQHRGSAGMGRRDRLPVVREGGIGRGRPGSSTSRGAGRFGWIRRDRDARSRIGVRRSDRVPRGGDDRRPPYRGPDPRRRRRRDPPL